MSDDVARKVAEILLDIKAVSFRVSPPFTYASGILSPIYTDCRLLMSHPSERVRVIDLMAGMVASDVGDVGIVAGTASAGIPHAAWLSEKLGKPMIYVRKASKDHGKQNLIEGVLDEGAKVLLVEDLVSTGGSSIKAVDAVRSAGGVVSDCVSIFTYRLPKAEENFKNANVKLHALCDLETALALALERNYLTAEDGELARAWRQNPNEWAR